MSDTHKIRVRISASRQDIDREGILITSREGNYIRISVVYTPREVQPWYESITRDRISGQMWILLVAGSNPVLATNIGVWC